MLGVDAKVCRGLPGCLRCIAPDWPLTMMTQEYPPTSQQTPFACRSIQQYRCQSTVLIDLQTAELCADLHTLIRQEQSVQVLQMSNCNSPALPHPRKIQFRVPGWAVVERDWQSSVKTLISLGKTPLKLPEQLSMVTYRTGMSDTAGTLMARVPSLHHTKFVESTPKILQLPPNLKAETTPSWRTSREVLY